MSITYVYIGNSVIQMILLNDSCGQLNFIKISFCFFENMMMKTAGGGYCDPAFAMVLYLPILVIVTLNAWYLLDLS